MWWAAGLPWWGGLNPLVLKKKLFVRQARGKALKIGQVLNCKRLGFRAEVLKLGGVKGLQGGREHCSDVMIECYISIYFQTLFLSNIKTCFPKTAPSFPLSPCEMYL